jgi:hypothetical protein
VPGRNREPDHVAQRAGIPGGDLAREREHLWGKNRLGTDHLAKWREPAIVLGRGSPGQDVPVDVLPGKPHLHPYSCHGKIGHWGGHYVLEGAIQMRKPHVHENQGHRIDLGGRRSR